MTTEQLNQDNARTKAQRVYERYLLAILLNLAVLGLFAEHWSWVNADSFSVILLSAVVLQLLLQLTINLEKKIASKLQKYPSSLFKFVRFFWSWFVLAGSKFVMLGCLSWVFGPLLQFKGPYHGVVAFLIVLFSMLLTEQLAVRFYRLLA